MNDTRQSGVLLHGIGIGEGCALGPLVFFERCVQKKSREVGNASDERLRLFRAIEGVKENLERLERITRETAGEGEAEIFGIHAMLLSDADLGDAMEEALGEGASAETAVENALKSYAEKLREIDDPYLSARAGDLEDLSSQLLRALSGASEEISVTTDADRFLLVAEDLLPSETVTLDRSRILGFVMMSGSPTSHTAILSKAMGIPALLGVGRIDRAYAGCTALLDARAGTLLLEPDAGTVEGFRAQQRTAEASEAERLARLRKIVSRPAITQSGKKLLVYANVGDKEEARLAADNGADGIGLLRSELLYLSLDRYPLEEELLERYVQVSSCMKGKRTVIRTLDVGADKQAACLSLPREENPALGLRGIRVCLSHEAMFKTQLRAILRASAHAPISLMLPMIVSVEEVRKSRALLSECMRELDGEGHSYDRDIELGVMIETPAAAIMSEELAHEVDFFSVGTNDLTQYTLAVDRQNPSVSHIAQENQEAVLRLIGYATNAIHKTGGWIGICGELAADLQLTQRFADMGIDELSVSPPYLLELRQRIMECK